MQNSVNHSYSNQTLKPFYFKPLASPILTLKYLNTINQKAVKWVCNKNGFNFNETGS